MVKVIEVIDGERRVRFRRRDDDFRVLSTWEDPEDDFDPRLRPWFSAAVEADAANWTEPYVFFASRRPGVSTANAMLGVDGGSWRGVAVYIELAAFSGFLDQLSGANEVASIVDRDGQVVALPERPERCAALFEPIPTTGIPSVSGAAFQAPVAGAAANGGRFGEIDVSGRRYLSDVRGFERVPLP